MCQPTNEIVEIKTMGSTKIGPVFVPPGPIYPKDRAVGSRFPQICPYYEASKSQSLLISLIAPFIHPTGRCAAHESGKDTLQY